MPDQPKPDRDQLIAAPDRVQLNVVHVSEFRTLRRLLTQLRRACELKDRDTGRPAGPLAAWEGRDDTAAAAERLALLLDDLVRAGGFEPAGEPDRHPESEPDRHPEGDQFGFPGGVHPLMAAEDQSDGAK